jgi:hypothetical protein
VTLESDLIDIFTGDEITAEEAAELIAAAILANSVSIAASGMPPKSIIMTNVSAADIADTAKFDGTGLGVGSYLGWAICNGSNGTPNLQNRFPRMKTSGATGTGGSDTNSHTHTGGAHTHGTEGAVNGTLRAQIDVNSGTGQECIYANADSGTENAFTADRMTEAFGGIGITTPPLSGGTPGDPDEEDRILATPVQGATDSGGAVATGAPTDTENRPAYYELVPLMRL